MTYSIDDKVRCLLGLSKLALLLFFSIKFLDAILPVFYLKHKVLESGLSSSSGKILLSFAQLMESQSANTSTDTRHDI
jgi:hypothetical protein